MQKTVILFGSSRGDGNTKKVVDLLAAETGFDVVNIHDHSIGFFAYDWSNADDDFLPLMEKLIPQYDTFIWATPVYWYSMSAQMKTFLDRFSDLLHYKPELGRALRGKSWASIACSHGPDLPDGFFMPFKASADYLGMDYLGDLQVWCDGGPLTPEVEGLVKGFAGSLKKIEIS